MHRKPLEGIPLHPLIALWILQKEGRLLPQTGIVYVRNRKQCAVQPFKIFPLLQQREPEIQMLPRIWQTAQRPNGLSGLAYRVDPTLYDWFLEQRWNAGLYDQVLYDIYHTTGDKTTLAERWRERIQFQPPGARDAFVNRVDVLIE